jgi:hypothetical protein
MVPHASDIQRYQSFTQRPHILRLIERDSDLESLFTDQLEARPGQQ